MNTPLSHLVIRDAITTGKYLGFIIAGDPNLDNDDVPHTKGFCWYREAFVEGASNYSAISLTFVNRPSKGVLQLAISGDYTFETTDSAVSNNIFDQVRPRVSNSRYGLFRGVTSIDGKAYAFGYRGIVCRFDDVAHWTRIDEGLPSSFDIEAVGGFAESSMYAVGLNGQIWTYDGFRWRNCESPTNLHLSSVKCHDDQVYVSGKTGIVIRGDKDYWEILEQDGFDKDIWDIESFQGDVFISTMSGLYILVDDIFTPVNFGVDTPSTTYKLDATSKIMWSIGAKDVMEFDGEDWRRIV